jgi:hypothetical protein
MNIFKLTLLIKQNKNKVVEMSEEMARDLEVLKMRAAFDPKHFYKKDQSLAAHKQIQVFDFFFKIMLN